MSRQEQAQIVHAAIATAYSATERAQRIALEHAQPGVAPAVTNAATDLASALILALRAMNDTNQKPK